MTDQTAVDMRRDIVTALDGLRGHWDIDALTAELWGGYPSLDQIPESVFWDAVLRHELPAPADPAESFRTELSAAIARQSRGDRDAIWTDGVVTVRTRGISRVNQTLPQPLARFRIETAADTIDVPDPDEVTWTHLWELVDLARTQADTMAAATLSALHDTAARTTKAQATLTAEQSARTAAIRAASAAGNSVADIAKTAGLSAPAVYKILGK